MRRYLIFASAGLGLLIYTIDVTAPVITSFLLKRWRYRRPMVWGLAIVSSATLLLAPRLLLSGMTGIRCPWLAATWAGFPPAGLRGLPRPQLRSVPNLTFLFAVADFPATIGIGAFKHRATQSNAQSFPPLIRVGRQRAELEGDKCSMDRKFQIKYWLDSAEDDWRAAGHLFEKGDYPYALFFGHLTIEKILKGIYAGKHDDVPPFTHRLVYIAEKIPIPATPLQLELLEIITDFNLEARYPDEKFTFKRKCTKKFTKEQMARIGEVRQWLLEQIQK